MPPAKRLALLKTDYKNSCLSRPKPGRLFLRFTCIISLVATHVGAADGYINQTEERILYYVKSLIADTKFEIETYNRRILAPFKDYLTFFTCPDYVINATPEEIWEENTLSICKNIPYSELPSGVTTAFDTFETLALLKKTERILIDKLFLLLHGAAISLINGCYIFTAPSGTGKTTHILNLKKMFPETIIINGDKPLINTETKLVYGTPWCGKEGYNTNMSAPLAGIISLEMGEENSIKPITFHEMLPVLLQQTYIPKERELALKAYSLIGNFKDVPCYKLT